MVVAPQPNFAAGQPLLHHKGAGTERHLRHFWRSKQLARGHALQLVAGQRRPDVAEIGDVEVARNARPAQVSIVNGFIAGGALGDGFVVGGVGVTGNGEAEQVVGGGNGRSV